MIFSNYATAKTTHEVADFKCSGLCLGPMLDFMVLEFLS